ncbi:MAG TPA: glycosyltransferase family 1 protein [Sediminispirochaeta sp.]|nr:glycosyltransferase family 1 protein [Sediminispirochaeta sp.]
MITVLAYYERISVYHTMEPFFLPRYRGLFHFTASPEYCLRRDRNRVLFMERWFKNDLPPDLDLMRRLRERYERIVFFDGYAAAGTHLLELLPYVDILYHKALFNDQGLYRKQLYNKRLFADYYAERYQIRDDEPEYPQLYRPTDDELAKIRLSWNIGLGDYPRRHLPQRLGVLISRLLSPRLGRLIRSGGETPPPDFSSEKRATPVHARFGLVDSRSVAMQRKLFIDLIADHGSFATGFVPQKRYYRDLYDAKMTLSPFGWGEVCFRDFEAVVTGSMLLKPDMSHLRTWPDIYIPYETYVPLSWDGDDLFEKVDYYLSRPKERSRIAAGAFEQYRKQRHSLPERFEAILQESIDR